MFTTFTNQYLADRLKYVIRQYNSHSNDVTKEVTAYGRKYDITMVTYRNGAWNPRAAWPEARNGNVAKEPLMKVSECNDAYRITSEDNVLIVRQIDLSALEEGKLPPDNVLVVAKKMFSLAEDNA